MTKGTEPADHPICRMNARRPIRFMSVKSSDGATETAVSEGTGTGVNCC